MRTFRTQHSTSTSGSNRRVPPPRGLRLASPSRASPSSCSSPSAFLSYEAFPHAEVRRLRIHVSCGSALPSSGSTASSLLVYARDVRPGGRTDVLSRSRLPVSSSIALHMSSPLPGCSAEPLSTGASGRVFPGRDCVHLRVRFPVAQGFKADVLDVLRVPGRSDVFPGRDRVRLHVHCCLVLFCRWLPTQRVRAWPGGALFSGWLDWSFISSSKSGSVDDQQSRTGLCCLVSTYLTTKTT